jgi:hypothetical protein
MSRVFKQVFTPQFKTTAFETDYGSIYNYNTTINLDVQCPFGYSDKYNNIYCRIKNEKSFDTLLDLEKQAKSQFDIKTDTLKITQNQYGNSINAKVIKNQSFRNLTKTTDKKIKCNVRLFKDLQDKWYMTVFV